MKRTFGAPVPYDAASYIEELEAEVDRLRAALDIAIAGRARERTLERARALPVIEAAREVNEATTLEMLDEAQAALRAALAEYDR